MRPAAFKYADLEPFTDAELEYVDLILDDPWLVKPPPTFTEYRMMLTIRTLRVPT